MNPEYCRKVFFNQGFGVESRPRYRELGFSLLLKYPRLRTGLFSVVQQMLNYKFYDHDTSILTLKDLP